MTALFGILSLSVRIPPLWCENSPHFGCVLELLLLTFGTLVVARALPDHKRIPFFFLFTRFLTTNIFRCDSRAKRNNAVVRSLTTNILRGFGFHEFATARARFLTTNIF